MKSLALKKKILTIVALTILLGNGLRMFSGVPDSVALNLDSPVFAEAAFESDFGTLPTSNYNFTDASLLTIEKRIEDIDLNPEHIRKIQTALAQRGSPMADQAYFFEKMAVKYDLPYNLMPAIAIIESGGGKHNYRPYNYAGMGGQGAAMTFANYEQAIEKHAQILRYGYFDSGANIPARIAPYYCPPCTTWHTKVQSVMYEIDSK